MNNRAISLAALLLCAAAAAASAQGGPPPGGRGRGGPGGRGGACAATADSLTDVQKGQVRALNDAFAKAHTAELDKLREIMDAARAARQAGKSEDEIRA